MVQVLTPVEAEKKYGKTFCKRFITLVDEKAGRVRIIESCTSVGPAEWDIVNLRRSRGAVKNIRNKYGSLEIDAEIGESEIKFGPASEGLGARCIKKISIEGDEVRMTWYALAGATVGIGACLPACPDIIRTEYPDDFKIGGGHMSNVDIITPKYVRVVIGIDDTDTKEKGATWVVGMKMGLNCPIGRFIEHKIIQLNPKAPNKTTNCCSTAVVFAVRESEKQALIDYAKKFVAAESYSDDAVMAVYQGLEVPREVSEFGWTCKSVLFSVEDAQKIADENGIEVIRLKGGNGGVIGAVAAIGCSEMDERSAGIPEDFQDIV